jgi:dinuclear metal center YbgI/SA1388 family protein
MTVNDITSCLEEFAPLSYQESYDNAGLLIGDPESEVRKALITLDITNDVLDEAIQKECNLVISHHPLIFHPLKKLSGRNDTQQMVVKAIRNNIAVYAMHTNLDNSVNGLNWFICKKLGLVNCSLLSPLKGMLRKLITFCPIKHAEKVRQALFDAGAGRIGNYDSCSYSLEGKGSFRALENAKPFVGEKNRIHFEDEIRIEVIYPLFREEALINALKENHPYEEVAYDLYPLSNTYGDAGSGMKGELDPGMDISVFLDRVKSLLRIPVLRHSKSFGQMIRKVAVCTGSGSGLIAEAKKAGTDIFLTADLKYHDFFEAGDNLLLADIGHYESETFAKELIIDILIGKFPNFAFLGSEVNTNPIMYY